MRNNFVLGIGITGLQSCTATIDTMQDFLSYDLEGLRLLMAAWDQPSWRARQISAWVWQRDAADYAAMTDLPASLRERLATELPLRRAAAAERRVSRDATRKYLLRLADGVAVETVAIPGTGGGSSGSADQRLTVCVSSQAGCALGCVFCATGRAGLTRSLGAGEIAEQVRVVSEDFSRVVTNVVVMGQGEPFANYDATLGALRLLNSPEAFNIGARHLTVSTSGLIAGIARLAAEPEQFRLAVSLHAATQELRDRLMPGLRGQPLTALREALIDYRARSGRRVSLEYVLLRDVNDHESDLDALANFARATQAHVNLLPYNDTGTKGSGSLSPSARTREAAEFLRAAGIETSVRRSRGEDIAAACGQLAGSA